MHRLEPCLCVDVSCFRKPGFNRHGLSTASPRPVQAQSRACAGVAWRGGYGSFLQKLPHAGDELLLGLAVRGHDVAHVADALSRSYAVGLLTGVLLASLCFTVLDS
jgi:hypothetical protein